MNKPIIFLGSSENYLSTKNEDPLQSYFSFFKDRTDEEINNYITYYMNSLGYIYPVVTEKEQVEKAVEESEKQNIYPQTGYVKEYEDYIVVKLGE